jgi:aspartyl-tRNA(Asn)/glutamyl-tRNA(Gln) amidotransferase subunit B
MVSFKFIKTAIEFEARRQIEIYESGGAVSQDTMHYNQDSGTTSVMRSKEDALDYRYFPDPDLLPVVITDDEIEAIRKTLPELPATRRARYMNDLGLSEYDATRLTESADISKWFESAVGDKPARAKPVANWMISELFAHPEIIAPQGGAVAGMATEGVTLPGANSGATPPREGNMKPSDLSELVDLVLSNEINGKQAKEIFTKMLDGESGTPKQIADKFGMKQITDTGAIESEIDSVLSANAAQVAEYKSGKVGLMGFFVGAVMKATGGKANPAVVNEILKTKLS